MEQNRIEVFDKNMNKLAVFTDAGEGLEPLSMENLMIGPQVHLESGGIASFSFQMLASSEKWDQIKSPLNLYHVDNRWYSPMNEDSYEYSAEGDDGEVSVVNVVCLEIEALLSRQYHMAFNCSLYAYCRATFLRYTNDGAVFQLTASGCSVPGNAVLPSIVWQNSVSKWTAYDDNGNRNSFAILTASEYAPVNWESPPSAVWMKSFSVSGNTATMTIESRVKRTVNHVFQYNLTGKTYQLDAKPFPSKIDGVKINSTVVTTSGNTATYNTSDKDISNYSYNASTGVVTLSYVPISGEQINGLTVTYTQDELGTINPGAVVYLAHGAEPIDEHSFVILPKAKSKYNLVVDNVIYSDSQVRDSRNVVMPRGSGGYAMWAALKNTGWTLGVCDVIAKGFDTSIDYGCFNIESDMKSTLDNIQYIASLYGGILDFDSEHKIVNYRAENDEDYDSYKADSFNEWRGYTFREGKNLTSKPVISVDNNIITRAYILGYGNLNIRKINGGKSYVENFSYTDDLYEGYLTQNLIYDTNDESGQRMLKFWGEKELKKQCRPRTSIKLSVTDLRTVEGHEFEKFDINEVVRVYYWDEHAQENVIKDQRVIVWEYNPFAYWESEIELGDVTLNKTDLFKLIYKKVENNPSADNNGNISGSNITIGSGGFGSGSYEGYDQNSLPAYIDAIARTTTKNSDAIAGLILDTDAVHAQVDLFAQYQKQTDNLFAQTYAGLTFYADEKKAEAIVSANNYTETKTQELDGSLTQRISQTEAALRVYADEKGSEAQLLATGYYNTLNNKIGQLETWAQAGFTAEQNARYALSQQFSAFQTSINNQIYSINNAGYITYADAESAAFSAIAQQIRNGTIVSQSAMESYVDDSISRIDLSTQFQNNLASMQIVSDPSRSYIKFTANELDFNVGATVYIERAEWYFNYGAEAHFESGGLYLGARQLKLVWDNFTMADGSTKRVNFVSFD